METVSRYADVARRTTITLSISSLALISGSAGAGRPMATDDAGTVGARTCQLESWYERSRTSSNGDREYAKEFVMSPACGIGDAVEINVELARSLPTDGVRVHSTLAAKWVDPAWEHEGLRWGLKAWRGTAHSESSSSWQPEGTGASGLLSWELSDALTVHTNLGFERDHMGHHTNGLANVALDAAVTDRLQWFAEALKVRGERTSVNTGLRWWLAAERFAIDLTGGHTGGSDSQKRVSIGFGWYGLGW